MKIGERVKLNREKGYRCLPFKIRLLEINIQNQKIVEDSQLFFQVIMNKIYRDVVRFEFEE